MRKSISILIIIATPVAACAQTNRTPGIDGEIFKVCASIFTVALFMTFILAILKRILDYRLKNRIVEKGIQEAVASSILQTNFKEDGDINIKWFAVLTGIGAGLTIVNYTLPLGMHSLAIMAFSIAASFLGYFFFIRLSKK